MTPGLPGPTPTSGRVPGPHGCGGRAAVAVAVLGAYAAFAAEPPAIGAKNPPPEPLIFACQAAQRPDLVRAGTALVAGTDGWIFRMDDLRGDFVVQPGTVEALKHFVDAWAARGTHVALVLLPPRGVLGAANVDRSQPLATAFDAATITAAYRGAIRSLAGTGATVPDLLAAAGNAKLGERFFFRRDHHWTPEGARLAMTTVVAQLPPAMPAFTPVPYTNIADKQRSLPGELTRLLQKECGGEGYPPERFSPYLSRPSEQAITGDSLLGDAPPPEVVVAGSSHTNKGMQDTFNVAGWLREATGTDVLNVGVDGGGFSTGLLNWIDTDAARKSPPKLLVWEISGRIPDGLADFFREALPTVHGACAEPLQVVHATVGSSPVHLFTVEAPSRARDHYIFLTVSDPAFVEFRVGFDTQDGAHDSVLVRRSTRIPNSRRYFVSGPDSDSPLRAISIRGGLIVQAQVDARLCAVPSVQK